MDGSINFQNMNNLPRGTAVPCMLPTGGNHMLPLPNEQQQFIYDGNNRDVVKPKRSKAKNASRELVLKSPLALLNEICTKAGVEPTFDYSEEGPVHRRTFNCTVKVERNSLTWDGTATSKSKREAKQAAARSLLRMMDEGVDRLLIPETEASAIPISSVCDCDPEPPGNPVTELNDFCLKMKKAPPLYEELEEIGKPHERVYIMVCKLDAEISEEGKGRSKKLAKKAAAFKVLAKVNDMLREATCGEKIIQESTDVLDSSVLKSLLTYRKKQSPRLSEVVQNMRNKSGPKWSSLKDTAQLRKSDPILVLKEISEEQKFRVEYLNLPNSSNSTDHFCLISLNLDPMIVCTGKGANKSQAKKSASEAALESLCVMLQG